MEIILVKEKETPGTWRFKENKEDHPITIYLTKEQVKELGNPKSIKITITAAQRINILQPNYNSYNITIQHWCRTLEVMVQEEQLKTISGLLPFLIPLFIIEITLIVIALIDLFKRENMKNSTRVIWVLIIVLINLIGPIAYLLFGRKDKPVDSDQRKGIIQTLRKRKSLG